MLGSGARPVSIDVYKKETIRLEDKMKKLYAISLATLMAVSTWDVTAYAENDLQAEVYVTISDEKGELVLTQEKVMVTDTDNDGTLTIHDALYTAHEENYEGGAAEGYASSMGEYGMQLDRLWGTANGTSYGYCVNHQSAMGLGDSVKDGDFINAYVYTDLTAWSDTYCYFDANTIKTDAGKEIALTLSAAAYDAEWNPIVLPVEGAVIKINGEATEYTTDKEGKVTICIETEGAYVVSADSDNMTLVPPVCKVAVLAAEETEQTEDIKNTEETLEQETTTLLESETMEMNTQENSAPQTGEHATAYLYLMFLIVSVLGIKILSVKDKKSYEK